VFYLLLINCSRYLETLQQYHEPKKAQFIYLLSYVFLLLHVIFYQIKIMPITVSMAYGGILPTSQHRGKLHHLGNRGHSGKLWCQPAPAQPDIWKIPNCSFEIQQIAQ
jgi:hypothetical protein